MAGLITGFRLPKVESAADVPWVAERAPGVHLDCTIESVRGLLRHSKSIAVLRAHCCLTEVWSSTRPDFGRHADLGTGLASLPMRSRSK